MSWSGFDLVFPFLLGVRELQVDAALGGFWSLIEGSVGPRAIRFRPRPGRSPRLGFSWERASVAASLRAGPAAWPVVGPAGAVVGVEVSPPQAAKPIMIPTMASAMVMVRHPPNPPNPPM